MTLAVGDYDQVRDLALGRVTVPGLDLNVLNYDVEEIFFRFFDRLEWEASELSMGMYTSARSRGDDRFIAVPAFPSRVFRHSAIYIRESGKIRSVDDLAGARIGIPQWSQTATIYVRGFLAETAGIPLSSIKWIQAGVNDPGRAEPAVLRLPDDIRLDYDAGHSLDELLREGKIDALISARPPRSFVDGRSGIVRLFEDYKTAEAEYFRQTGIFPIMHTVALRRDAYEQNRWIARNLFVALREAKNRSVARLRDLTAAHIPLPWATELLARAQDLIFPEGEYWPYGIEPNLKTLEAFLRFSYHQGTCHRHLSVEEIFAPEASEEIRV